MATWEWFGTPLHLCVGFSCRYGMATLLPSGFLVSTVGSYFRTEPEKLDYDSGEEVGAGRKFETMVFSCSGNERSECGCPIPESWEEIDCIGYNTHKEANEGHMKACRKWSRAKRKESKHG